MISFFLLLLLLLYFFVKMIYKDFFQTISRIQSIKMFKTQTCDKIKINSNEQNYNQSFRLVENYVFPEVDFRLRYLTACGIPKF